MRMLNPPHPGTFIRTEVIEPLNLSVSAAATVLGVSRPNALDLSERPFRSLRYHGTTD